MSAYLILRLVGFLFLFCLIWAFIKKRWRKKYFSWTTYLSYAAGAVFLFMSWFVQNTDLEKLQDIQRRHLQSQTTISDDGNWRNLLYSIAFDMTMPSDTLKTEYMVTRFNNIITTYCTTALNTLKALNLVLSFHSTKYSEDSLRLVATDLSKRETELKALFEISKINNAFGDVACDSLEAQYERFRSGTEISAKAAEVVYAYEKTDAEISALNDRFKARYIWGSIFFVFGWIVKTIGKFLW